MRAHSFVPSATQSPGHSARSVLIPGRWKLVRVGKLPTPIHTVERLFRTLPAAQRPNCKKKVDLLESRAAPFPSLIPGGDLGYLVAVVLYAVVCLVEVWGIEKCD